MKKLPKQAAERVNEGRLWQVDLKAKFDEDSNGTDLRLNVVAQDASAAIDKTIAVLRSDGVRVDGEVTPFDNYHEIEVVVVTRSIWVHAT